MYTFVGVGGGGWGIEKWLGEVERGWLKNNNYSALKSEYCSKTCYLK